VLKACASVNVKDLLAVIVDVSVILAGVIGLVSGVASNIVVELVPLLGAAISVCADLDLTAMIKVLGLGI